MMSDEIPGKLKCTPTVEIWETPDGQTVIRYVRVKEGRRATSFIPIDINEQWNALQTENTRLKQIFEKAPHGQDCDTRWYGMDHPCNCWKSEA